MHEDERCCGTGTCLINAEGLCWCGQQWTGTAMCFQPLAPTDSSHPGVALPPGTAPDLPTLQATAGGKPQA